MQPHLQAPLIPRRLWCRAGRGTGRLGPPGDPVLPCTRTPGLLPPCGLGCAGSGSAKEGLQSAEAWTTGRGRKGAGKGRGQTFGFSKVKEFIS